MDTSKLIELFPHWIITYYIIILVVVFLVGVGFEFRALHLQNSYSTA
jgi:hypothetical protein